MASNFINNVYNAYIKFIEIIKKTRIRKEISQSACARLLNMTQPAYSDIEAGFTKLKAEDFLKLCEFLEIDLDLFKPENRDKIVITITNDEKKVLSNILERLINS